ncbi:hypothetical protein HDU91_007532, partial [Kappamyces sp. JEL0680]
MTKEIRSGKRFVVIALIANTLIFASSALESLVLQYWPHGTLYPGGVVGEYTIMPETALNVFDNY